MTGLVVEILNDLSGWFGSRDVKTVTSVEYIDDKRVDGPNVSRDVMDGTPVTALGNGRTNQKLSWSLLTKKALHAAVFHPFF